MYLAGRWADRQLSRLELVVVIIIFSLLLSVFFQQMLKMFAVAERSLLNNTVTNINTGLNYRAAAYVIRGDFTALASMKGINPFALPDESHEESFKDMGAPGGMIALMGSVKSPPNYLGEMTSIDPGNVEGGVWYFDNSDYKLVYRVDNSEYFSSSLPGSPRVEFMVDIDYRDNDGDDSFDPNVDDFRTVRLKAINEFEWQIK